MKSFKTMIKMSITTADARELKLKYEGDKTKKPDVRLLDGNVSNSSTAPNEDYYTTYDEGNQNLDFELNISSDVPASSHLSISLPNSTFQDPNDPNSPILNIQTSQVTLKINQPTILDAPTAGEVKKNG
jgi:hypothetical protein